MFKIGDIIKTFLKKYEIVEQIDEETYLATCKNKKFLLRTFDFSSEYGQELEYSLIRIKSSGIKAPKLIKFDRKNGYYLTEYIEGIDMAEYISKNELTDEIYKQLFDNAYLAKVARATLRYEPQKWILSNGIMYYVYTHVLDFDPEKDLVKRYVRLWFNTKELEKYLIENGYSYDKKRIKDEYATNKEILLRLPWHNLPTFQSELFRY